MATPWKIRRTVDLGKWEQSVEYLGILAFTGAKNAHQLTLTVLENNKPASFDGSTVRAYFLRNKEKVMVGATVTSNIITVKFPKAAYAIEGRVSLIVRAEDTEDMVPIYGAKFAVDYGDESVTIDPDNLVKDISDLLAQIDDMKAVTADGKAAAEEARAAAKAATDKAADLQTQMDDYKATVDASLSTLKDAKADAIIDTSARADAHELHAQRGPLAVTLYGATTETGEGDKSPDNPYTISGVDKATLRVGSKNLLPFPYRQMDKVIAGVTFTAQSDGGINATGTPTAYADMLLYGGPVPCRGKVTASISGTYSNIGLNVALIDANGATLWGTSVGTEASVDFDAYPADATFYFYIKRMADDVAVSGKVYPMLEPGDTAHAYEPYTATTAELPLLPDGAPLHGNGVVDDTVENDVLSGYDKRIVLDGTEIYGAYDPTKWTTRIKVYCRSFPDSASGYIPRSNAMHGTEFGLLDKDGGYIAVHPYLDGYFYMTIDFTRLGIAATTDGDTGIAALKAYLAANPLTVYYRSTEYTPDKDLRVCRVVRRWKYTRPSSSGNWVQVADGEARFYCTGLVTGAGHPIDCEGFECYQAYSEWVSAYKAGKFAMCIESGVLYVSAPGYTTLDPFKTWWATIEPVTVWYADGSERTYVTDPLTLRKPDTLATDTVTVTGSGETEVSYPHTTKHYIDSQIAATVALALNS